MMMRAMMSATTMTMTMSDTTLMYDRIWSTTVIVTAMP